MSRRDDVAAPEEPTGDETSRYLLWTECTFSYERATVSCGALLETERGDGEAMTTTKPKDGGPSAERSNAKQEGKKG